MSTEKDTLIIEEEDTMKDRDLTFEIDNEEYGVEVRHISSIISIKDVRITQIPQTPNYVKGIMNLRGDILPIVDVRLRFMKAEREYDELTCVVVIIYNDSLMGLIVDTIHEVTDLPEENIAPPPSAKLNYYNQFITSLGRVDERVILLLDLDRLLTQE